MTPEEQTNLKVGQQIAFKWGMSVTVGKVKAVTGDRYLISHLCGPSIFSREELEKRSVMLLPATESVWKRLKERFFEMTPEEQRIALAEDGQERDILITVYIYDHSGVAEVDVGHVMRDLNCSYYAPCELVQRHFVISTDSYATNQACIDHFVKALEKSGLSIHGWKEEQPTEGTQ